MGISILSSYGASDDGRFVEAMLVSNCFVKWKKENNEQLFALMVEFDCFIWV